MKYAVLLLLLGMVACGGDKASDSAGSTNRKDEDAGKKLHQILDEDWQRRLRESPTFASTLGDRRYNALWPDMSLQAIEESHRLDQQVSDRLNTIDVQSLSQADQLNYKLFERELDQAIEGYAYEGYLIALNQRGGIQTENELTSQLRFETVKDYEDWIARLKAFPAYMDQTIALLQKGVEKKMVHPRVIMERLPGQISAQIVEDPTRSPFYDPFKEFPSSISSDEQTRLREEARQAIARNVVPSFHKLQDFFENSYLPASFDEVGIWQQPRGGERYAYLVGTFTTTDMTPQQVHDLGQSEVKRIRAEMQKVIEKVGFKGSFEEFLNFLRTDPQFYYKDPEALIAGYRELCKRIDPTLVKLFGRLPRTPYGVEPIPAAVAPDTTTAYYQQPAGDGSRPGTYYVNLYRPEVRPRYEMEALSIHESVPGHHLQIALAQELGELPEFRRYGGYTAFVEGWGLYAESLGEELGFYQDPYSKFGQLTYEMWRAVRLVVDTGIHELKWTRRQAIDFFKANAAKTELDIINEIDRYIAWPGQALAYKIGELKIKEMRSLAESELGQDFDIREFHDLVLGSGAIPLNILEENVRNWIKTRQSDQKGE